VELDGLMLWDGETDPLAEELGEILLDGLTDELTLGD